MAEFHLRAGPAMRESTPGLTKSPARPTKRPRRETAMTLEAERVRAAPARLGSELTVVVPTFKERDNIAELLRRLRACARRRRLGGGLRRRQLPRRHRGGRQGDRIARSARALSEARGAQGSCRRLRGGHPFLQRAFRGRDRRRSPARRARPSQNAGASCLRRCRSRGGDALCRRRQCRILRFRPRRHQQARNTSDAAPSGHAPLRSDERLLHDAPQPLRSDCGQTVACGLQDPARHRHDGGPVAAPSPKNLIASARANRARASSI